MAVKRPSGENRTEYTFSYVGSHGLPFTQQVRFPLFILDDGPHLLSIRADDLVVDIGEVLLPFVQIGNEFFTNFPIPILLITHLETLTYQVYR